MNDNNPLLMGVDIKRWSCVILHLVKQLDDVAYAQLLPTRSVPPKRPQLPPRNEIALGGVGLGEIGLHILDEGLATSIGRSRGFWGIGPKIGVSARYRESRSEAASC